MRNPVRAKKSLGQHFLKDENIASKIVGSLQSHGPVLEIGPGTGILTKYLMRDEKDFIALDVDPESIDYLKGVYPGHHDKFLHKDFLKQSLDEYFPGEYAIIGNFPYNISSQIMFRVLENRARVVEVVGMFQKEVAVRICENPGNKRYGILSVFLQAYYNTELLFTVSPAVFVPPPSVVSAVIRLTRKENLHLDCDEKLFFSIVKTAFNQRRKTLRNSLKSIIGNDIILPDHFSGQRPEQLGVEEFVELTNFIGQ